MAEEHAAKSPQSTPAPPIQGRDFDPEPTGGTVPIQPVPIIDKPPYGGDDDER